MINLLDIFNETYNEYLMKRKIVKHTSINKHKPCHIFENLHKFVDNSCYFKRFAHGLLNGKYLNEIHQSLINNSFYDILYSKLLNIYLKLTNYQSITELAGDSFFVRNIIGSESNKRNPQYYNKPGFKVNFIVDK